MIARNSTAQMPKGAMYLYDSLLLGGIVISQTKTKIIIESVAIEMEVDIPLDDSFPVLKVRC